MVAPVVTVFSTTPTTILLSWTSSGSVVNRYVIIWERDTSGECAGNDIDMAIILNGSTSYIIYGLEEHSSYTVTVTATNTAGTEISDSVSAITREAGKGQYMIR